MIKPEELGVDMITAQASGRRIPNSVTTTWAIPWEKENLVKSRWVGSKKAVSRYVQWQGMSEIC